MLFHELHHHTPDTMPTGRIFTTQESLARTALSDVLSEGDDASKIASLVSGTPSILDMPCGPDNATPLYEAVAAGRSKATVALVNLRMPIHAVQSVVPPVPDTPWKLAVQAVLPDLFILAALLESPVANAGDLLTCRDDLEHLAHAQPDVYKLYARVCARLNQQPTLLPPTRIRPRR